MRLEAKLTHPIDQSRFYKLMSERKLVVAHVRKNVRGPAWDAPRLISPSTIPQTLAKLYDQPFQQQILLGTQGTEAGGTR